MKSRFLASLLSLFAVVSMSPILVSGQTQSVTSGAAAVDRTPWGAPDLQGVWDFRSLTPMERPIDLETKGVYTAEEAAAFEAQRLAEIAALDDEEPADIVGNYNQFWFDRGTTVVDTNRTSLIVDPPNGRIPSLTSAAADRRATTAKAREGTNRHEPTPGGFVEDLGPGGLQVRCILGFNSGPPMAPSAYNNNLQLFQTEETVVLFAEMNHEARIVPLDGGDHVDSRIRQWTGNARGHWDGDTLVVETRNFLRETNFNGASTTEHLNLIERFTRIDEDTLQYEVTVNDPTVWTQPWTFSVPMKKNPYPVYEYACHEGNYGLYNILAGARTEADAADQRPR